MSRIANKGGELGASKLAGPPEWVIRGHLGVLRHHRNSNIVQLHEAGPLKWIIRVGAGDQEVELIGSDEILSDHFWYLKWVLWYKKGGGVFL